MRGAGSDAGRLVKKLLLVAAISPFPAQCDSIVNEHLLDPSGYLDLDSPPVATITTKVR